MRQTVALAGVDVLARPDEIFPSILAAARAGQDMIEAAFLGFEEFARVLATVVVALANRAGAELRALLGHLREIHRDNHRGHADWAAHGLHRVVLRTNRQGDPLLPTHWTDVVFA